MIEKDKQFVWHPFTQAKTAKDPTPIVAAKGAYLIDENGEQYFDAISSWWVTLHGHTHPHIASQIAKQANLLEQVIFANFTHIGAVTLAERLVSLLDIGKGRVFYSDNGSTAIETALKMALQFWHNLSSRNPKHKIISFKNAYHGDTFGAMSASSKTPFNTPFWPFLFEVHQIDPPYKDKEEASLQQLKKLLISGDVACFIFEPLIQGVAGMQVHSANGLSALLDLCKEHGVITIADEVMTGFGRTGPIFASHKLTRRADITCLSKGITGGFMPFGATVCKEEIFQGFLSDHLKQALLHGHSYCANPLACAAALASLDLLEEPTCTQQRQMIETCYRTFASKYGSHPSLKRCDLLGTILALEYKDESHLEHNYFSQKRNSLTDFFYKKNILIRPLGNVLYLMPPYCTTEADLNHVFHTIISTLERSR